MTKDSIEERPVIVKKVAVLDTLRGMRPGTHATFACVELGSFSTVSGTVSVLNSKAGRKEYAIETTDKGMTYTIYHF